MLVGFRTKYERTFYSKYEQYVCTARHEQGIPPSICMSRTTGLVREQVRSYTNTKQSVALAVGNKQIPVHWANKLCSQRGKDSTLHSGLANSLLLLFVVPTASMD